MRVWYSRGTAAALALILAFAAASPVSAANWSRERVVAGPGNVFAGHLVALSASELVVVYWSYPSGRFEADAHWVLRSSSDAGRSWSSPRRLSNHEPAISGHGRHVDIVQKVDNRIRYMRSTNGGETFRRPIVLNPPGQRVGGIDVEHAADGTVAVLWHVRDEGTYVRISTTHGRTFGPRKLVVRAAKLNSPDLAFGEGVMYLTYQFGYRRLFVQRSLDAGATWSRPTQISSQSDSFFDSSITAEGESAFVAFEGFPSGDDGATFTVVSYASTSDGGRSWSEARHLAPPDWDTRSASISLDGGVAHAIFDRCTPDWDVCDDTRVFYRRSVDGVTWSRPRRVSSRSHVEAWGAGVDAFGGRAFVLLSGYGWDDGQVLLRVRSR